MADKAITRFKPIPYLSGRSVAVARVLREDLAPVRIRTARNI
jgi:hypothetical protein